MMSRRNEDQTEIAENDERATTLSSSSAVAAAAAESRGNKRKKNANICDNANKWKLPRAVVAPELMDNRVSLRNAWVGTLREERDISLVMRAVSKILPEMSHLKRCSGKRLVLAFAAPDETGRMPDRYYTVRQDIENLLTNNGVDLSVFKKEFDIVSVPAGRQRTKAQASIASEIWPINFHPDPLIERTLNGCWFDRGDLDIIERCMGACIEAAARQAHGNEECNGSATAFDPNESKIVAVAASRNDRHPMWHATMLVLDLVARLGDETAGAYELTARDNEPTEEKSLLGTDSPLTTLRLTRKRKCSMRQRDDERLVAYPTDLVDIVDRYAPRSSLTLAAPAVHPSRRNESSAGSGYLCTNYWIFLLREPCPLCAMALLHSRVSNVFYGIANEYRGVLGSRALLHTTPGLNHRYRVWRGIREEECRQTFNEISRRMRIPALSLSTSS